MRTQVMKLGGTQQPTHLRHDEQQLHKELPRAPQSVAHHLTVTDHRCSLQPPLTRHLHKHAGGTLKCAPVAPAKRAECCRQAEGKLGVDVTLGNKLMSTGAK